jgi:hypothetical protein
MLNQIGLEMRRGAANVDGKNWSMARRVGMKLETSHLFAGCDKRRLDNENAQTERSPNIHSNFDWLKASFPASFGWKF